MLCCATACAEKSTSDVAAAANANQIRDLSADRIKSEERIAALTAQIKSIETGASSSTAELNETIIQLKTKVRTLELDRSSALDQVVGLETKLKASDAAAAAKTLELTAQLTAASAKLSESDAKSAELGKEKAKIEDLTRELNETLAKREEELKTLKAKAKSKLDLAQTTVTKLKTEYTNLRTMYLNEKKVLSDRITELETDKQTIAAATDTERKSTADKQKAEMEKLRSELERQILESERMRKETETSAKSKIDQLRSDGLKLKEMAQRMQLRLKTLTANLQTRKTLITQLQASAKQSAEAVNTLRKEVTTQMSGLSSSLQPVVGDAVRAYVNGATAVVLAKYRAEVKQRKLLHNQLQELKGNIRVFARVRAMNADEQKNSKLVRYIPHPTRYVCVCALICVVSVPPSRAGCLFVVRLSNSRKRMRSPYGMRNVIPIIPGNSIKCFNPLPLRVCV